jgi:hypothetical protein
MSKQPEKCQKKLKNIPCIWPIVNSLSNLSVPARSSSLPPLASKNFLLSPLNQPSQNGCVLAKSVRQTQVRDGVCGDGFCLRRAGTAIRADVLLRIVRDRMLYAGHEYVQFTMSSRKEVEL